MTRVVTTGAFVLVCLGAAPADAQFAVIDPAVLAQNITRYVLDKQVLDHIDAQKLAVYRSARRIVDVGIDVGRWVSQGMPPWTVWQTDPTLSEAARFMADLNAGRRGGGYAAIASARRHATNVLERVSPSTAATLRSELATIDALEETVLTAVEGVGRIRAQSGSRHAAMLQAERDLRSTTGSTAALLDAQSGLALLRSRQTEDTGQLLTPALAMLVAQAKRDRDADMVTRNMRAAAQERRARHRCADDECPGGMADTFRNWSQP